MIKKWTGFLMFVITIEITLPFSAFCQIERWVYRFEGPQSYEQAWHLTVGEDNSVYVTGQIAPGSSVDGDFTIIKLDTLGNVIHIYSFEGLYSYDWGYRILLGEDGNIYAAGVISYHGVVCSVDTQLNLNWRYDVDNASEIRSITKGETNRIYFLANIGGWEIEDIAVTKMDCLGNIDWIYSYGNQDAEIGNEIIKGLDGNLYVAGKDGFNGNVSDSLLVLSVSPDGNLRWVHYEGGINNNAVARSIVYGNDNNIYVTGYVNDGDNYGRENLYIIALDTLGNKLWDYRYDGPASFSDWGTAIDYGSDGNVYVTGKHTVYSSVASQIVVISIDRQGNQRWIYNYSTASTQDEGYSIVYAPNHHIYVSGVSRVASNDIVIICLDTLGNEQWVYRYDGPDHAGDNPNYGIVYKDGCVYVPAQSYDSTTLDDFTVICVADTTLVGKKEEKEILPTKTILAVYPNPFSEKTEIRYKIQDTRYTIADVVQTFRFAIYDATGRLVSCLTLDAKRLTPVVWDGTDDSGRRLPSGVYFVVPDRSNIDPASVVKIK
uniref:FlgD/Vpr Ig-like domain-containing protein n=1 Tax=candidate division WOR-3 bacterium TaxID=2052148 RepID=A0A7C4TIX4_UNCW3